VVGNFVVAAAAVLTSGLVKEKVNAQDWWKMIVGEPCHACCISWNFSMRN
jgi:hypothetical protein